MLIAESHQTLTAQHAEHKMLTGTHLSCVEESSGQAVIDYKTTLWPANQVGCMTVSLKVIMLTCMGMHSPLAQQLDTMAIPLGSMNNTEADLLPSALQLQGLDLAILVGAFLTFQDSENHHR